MAEVIFEYEDDRGETHRVRDIHRVPKRYLKTVISYESDEGPVPEPAAHAKTITVSQPLPDALAQFSGRILQQPASAALIPALLILIWWRFNNYLIRILVATTVFFWLFINGFHWFMASRYSQVSTPEHSVFR